MAVSLISKTRKLAREGGGPAAARVARIREYHVFDQHAEGHAGTRSLHRAVPFPPHRDFRVFVGSTKSWVRKVLVKFLECPGGAIRPRNPRIPVPPRPDLAGKIAGILPIPIGRYRENIRDLRPDPIRPGFREIGESRFGRNREIAGIYASINRDQDRDRDPKIFGTGSSRNAGSPPLGQRRNGTSTRSSS